MIIINNEDTTTESLIRKGLEVKQDLQSTNRLEWILQPEGDTTIYRTLA